MSAGRILRAIKPTEATASRFLYAGAQLGMNLWGGLILLLDKPKELENNPYRNISAMLKFVNAAFTGAAVFEAMRNVEESKGDSAYKTGTKTAGFVSAASTMLTWSPDPTTKLVFGVVNTGANLFTTQLSAEHKKATEARMLDADGGLLAGAEEGHGQYAAPSIRPGQNGSVQ
jgi:hypothetical protein